MNVREFYEYMCQKIPSSLTLSGDYDGLSCCPDPEREVTKAMIALDVTDAVIDEAIEEKCEVIVAHHPMLYGGLKEVVAGSVKGNKLIKLIRAGISVMSFHTRLDAVDGGVNDCLSALTGLENVRKFGENGICRIGELPFAVTAEMLAVSVRDALGAPHADYSDAGRLIKTVAVCGGSAGSFVEEAR
ncbi:MAG: Nif3-like dinuclear metal center hexameric protein, partial [Clostridia bacterium]|nr:Nif3-like dinuclear metal center hexameric protein [Clostridia bacterium]